MAEIRLQKGNNSRCRCQSCVPAQVSGFLQKRYVLILKSSKGGISLDESKAELCHAWFWIFLR